MRPTRAAVLLLAAACTAPRPAAAPPAPAAAVAAPAPAWAQGAVFHEIFVRSFQDSDGDGKGDLRGLASRLDYLNDGDPATERDLGVDALWLMPVFASPSYHGYDTTDYETIDPDYGTNEDFARLLAEAHRRGMKVIVDLVLNHTGSGHPWFAEASSSPASPRRDWYVWSPTDPGWGPPWNPAGRSWHPLGGAFYYAIFWRGMPDLNFRNPAVRAEMKRLASLWLSRGVDGFRLDAVRHLVETGPGELQNDSPETHAVLGELAAHVRASSPEALLVGEAWTETPAIARYYQALPANFDFPLARRIVEGVRGGDAAAIGEKLREIARTYPPGALDAPFLTNHDQRRVASELGGDPGKLRSAASVLLTLPGAPFLYYGEEVGMANGPGGEDEWKRTPMAWDATPGGGFTAGRPWHGFAPGRETANVASQDRDPSSLLSHYRRLVRARHASPALSRGSLELVAAEGPLLAWLRTRGAERVLVAHNLGPAPLSARLPVRAGRAVPLLAPEGASLAAGGAEAAVVLPPHGSGAYRLD
jgi:glycosidase